MNSIIKKSTSFLKYLIRGLTFVSHKISVEKSKILSNSIIANIFNKIKNFVLFFIDLMISLRLISYKVYKEKSKMFSNSIHSAIQNEPNFSHFCSYIFYFLFLTLIYIFIYNILFTFILKDSNVIKWCIKKVGRSAMILLHKYLIKWSGSCSVMLYALVHFSLGLIPFITSYVLIHYFKSLLNLIKTISTCEDKTEKTYLQLILVDKISVMFVIIFLYSLLILLCFSIWTPSFLSQINLCQSYIYQKILVLIGSN